MTYKEKYKDPNYHKKYRLKNADKIAEYKKEYNKEYRFENKNKIAEYQKEYQKEKLISDVQFKLCQRLRTRLWLALKKNKKSGSAVRDLGCTVEELKFYIESQFQEGMSWENWGRAGTEKKWNIDHKIPLAFFDLTDKEQFKQAVHYSNLQPLWAVDNIRKRDKVLKI